MQGIRFSRNPESEKNARWTSDFYGGNPIFMEGIRFLWLESDFYGNPKKMLHRSQCHSIIYVFENMEQHGKAKRLYKSQKVLYRGI